MRLSAPAKDPPPPYWGVSLVNESRRFDSVGSVASVSREMAVAAPVRAELNTASDCATTVTSSVTASVRSVSVRSLVTPRLTNTSLVTAGWNPWRELVTV